MEVAFENKTWFFSVIYKPPSMSAGQMTLSMSDCIKNIDKIISKYDNYIFNGD